MQHHELIQMIDNCAQAAQRNDRDALKSFPKDWPSTAESDAKKLKAVILAMVPPKSQAIILLRKIAENINHLETTVIPAMAPADLMRLQIELAGFKSSFPYHDPASSLVNSPVASTPESRN